MENLGILTLRLPVTTPGDVIIFLGTIIHHLWTFIFTPIMIRLFPALAIVSLAVAPSTVHGLWPNPASITTGSHYLKLSSSFSITFNSGLAPSDLASAITSTKKYLKNDRLERLIVGRGATDAPHLGTAKQLKTLNLSLTNVKKGHTVPSIMDNAIMAAEMRDESYSLTVPSDGSSATLTASNAVWAATHFRNHSQH